MPLNVSDAQGVDSVDHNGKDCKLDDVEYLQALRCEAVRLKSFINWPASSPVQPEELVRDGFYYMKTGDKVKCIFCNLILKSWQPGDIVRDEHVKFNANCPFLLQKQVGNVPIPVLPEGVSCGVWSEGAPKFPEFSKPAAREATFDKMTISLTQTPQELAEAGFFYQGHSDNMQCYYCGVLLKNWEPADDPWGEHQHWSSKCEHLKQRPVSHEKFPLTPIMKRAKEMGYEETLIKHAVVRKRRSGGVEFSDLNELVEELEHLRIQQEMISNSPTKINEMGPPTGSHTTAAGGSVEHMNFEDLKMCKICAERELEVTFIPCGHFMACEPCGQKLRTCPICRKHIKGTVRTFWS